MKSWQERACPDDLSHPLLPGQIIKNRSNTDARRLCLEMISEALRCLAGRAVDDIGHKGEKRREFLREEQEIAREWFFDDDRIQFDAGIFPGIEPKKNRTERQKMDDEDRYGTTFPGACQVMGIRPELVREKINQIGPWGLRKLLGRVGAAGKTDIKHWRKLYKDIHRNAA